MPFHLDSLWRATLMPLRACAMDSGWNIIGLLRLGINSGPILNRLWTKVHQILGLCRNPCTFQPPYPIVYVVFRSKRYSPLSLEVVEKPNKFTWFFAPSFLGGRPRLFYGRLLARFRLLSTVWQVWLSSVC